MADRPKPGYYAVIPADVRYDDQIPPNAKLLYGEISALCNSSGVCTAGNGYFAELYGVTERTIRGLIKALEDAGYIRSETVRDDKTGQIEGRHLFLAAAVTAKLLAAMQPGKGSASGKIFPEATGKDFPQASGKYFPPYIMYNNIYTSHKPPQGGDDPKITQKKRRGDYKTQAETQPERFEGFWTFYRKACPPSVNPGNRQKAIRAWDKLAPDEELVTQMARALARQTKSEQWTKGIGIPHASTWLNNHGWEDDWGEAAQMENTPEPEAQPTGDWL